ncbi:MAG TPA: TIGR02594 family protein [Xanthobacteraceae bacterium]|jgi:uncharacterized protein (TIGR02594 family)|nr:TIGR02594 family protein [Xanthobacteraceae bacterium]
MRVNFAAVVLLSSSMMVFAVPASADTPESSVHPINAYPIHGTYAAPNAAPTRARHAKTHRATQRARLSSRRATRGHAGVQVHHRAAERAHRRRASTEGASVARDNGSQHFASLGSPDVVSEARRWIGTNPTGRARLWCARFMNFVLKRVGLKGTSSDMARSFASYGRRVPGPRVGAIAVMSRGRGGGHVGVVSGIDAKGNPIIISGNYGRRVAEAKYPRGRIYAYVMP